jgi:glycosyltransferase involved in cell wall biosynthesis
LRKLTIRQYVLACLYILFRSVFDLSHIVMFRDLIYRCSSIWLFFAEIVTFSDKYRKIFVRLFVICKNQYVHAGKCPTINSVNKFLGAVRKEDISIDIDNEFVKKRFIVLKATGRKGVMGKGVLLIKSTEAISYAIRHMNIENLLESYFVILEPSWSGYFSHAILGWSKFNQSKILVHAPEEMDFRFLSAINTNLVPIEIGAGNYVDYRVFKEIPAVGVDFDIVYVALFKKYKRHHVLFKHVRKIKEKKLSIALVGSSWKGSRKEIELLAKFYGVFENIKIYEDVSPQKVNEILNRSKINILLSLREGANKAIFEGFFANVPGLILEENIGVNKKYFNDMTGVITKEKKLFSSIQYMLQEYKEFRPVSWASKNITPEIATCEIQEAFEILYGDCFSATQTRLATKVNSPELAYFEKSDEKNLSGWDFERFVN